MSLQTPKPHAHAFAFRIDAALSASTGVRHVMASSPVEPVVAELRGVVSAVLARLADDRPYALLDFPNYGNVGDIAIWRATLDALARAYGRPPAYRAVIGEVDPGACRRAIGGDGRVFFLGGGNFGDLYPDHHRHRLAAIEGLSGLSIVQLPQSLHFQARPGSALERTRRVLDAHGDVAILARDHPSLEMARELVGPERAELCPDPAHLLEPPTFPPAGEDVVFLWREDFEGRAAGDRGGAIDWFADPVIGFLDRLGHQFDPLRFPGRMAAREWIARAQLARGWSLLARGRALATDRLHGHILALSLGVPQVIVDSTTGKLFAYHEAWTNAASGVRLAASRAEAEEMARAAAHAASKP